MALKFYLNKFLKVDNIENYTLDTLQKLKDYYDEFLEDSEGIDPDFPLMSFGNKGQKIRGHNIYQALGDGESLEDFKLNKMHGTGLYSGEDSRYDKTNRTPDEMRKLTRQARDGQNKQHRR